MSQLRHIRTQKRKHQPRLLEAFSRMFVITFQRETKDFLRRKIWRQNRLMSIRDFIPFENTICLNLGQQMELVAFIWTALYYEPGILRIKGSHFLNKDWAALYFWLSGGHSASLPWWKDATLANNKVSYFFFPAAVTRLCTAFSMEVFVQPQP